MNILEKKVFFHPLNIHIKSNKPDIVIFTTGRSGGTWLTELLSMSRGIRAISEPLSLSLVTHPRKKDLLKYQPGKGFGFVHIPDEYYYYFSDILKGKLDPFPATKPIRKNFRSFHFITRRTVMKICHGKGMIKWFKDNFNVVIIYLYRHPVPTILSMLEQGFNSKYRGFMKDDLFMEKYLSENQKRITEDIHIHGTKIQKFALSWILENLIPYNYLKTGLDCIHLSHEEMVMYPDNCIHFLSERLNIDEDILLKNIRKPSSTTKKSSNQLYNNSKTGAISSWVDKIDSNAIRDIFYLMESFNNDLYTYNKYLPNEKYRAITGKIQDNI